MDTKEMAESIVSLPELMAVADIQTMYETINALVQLVGEMHKQCKGKDVGNGHKVFFGDMIEEALTKAAPIAALAKEKA